MKKNFGVWIDLFPLTANHANFGKSRLGEIRARFVDLAKNGTRGESPVQETSRPENPNFAGLKENSCRPEFGRSFRFRTWGLNGTPIS